MKRFLSGLFCILALSALLPGCQPAQGTGNAPKDNQLTYSTLTDASSREAVRKRLKAQKLNPEAVDRFFQWVDDYNTFAETDPLEGFTTIDGLEAPDQDSMEKWQEKRFYSDTNCRLTAFGLLRGLIQTENALPADNFLMFDTDAQENNPVTQYTPEETAAFYTLFNPVSIQLTTDEKEIESAVLNAWKERGISFSDGTAKLVSVIISDDQDSMAFVGHAGVLIEDGEGLLFVEKLSPTNPYQATKFANRDQLRQYLMHRFENHYTPELTAKPFLLLNDQAF